MTWAIVDECGTSPGFACFLNGKIANFRTERQAEAYAKRFIQDGYWQVIKLKGELVYV